MPKKSALDHISRFIARTAHKVTTLKETLTAQRNKRKEEPVLPPPPTAHPHATMPHRMHVDITTLSVVKAAFAVILVFLAFYAGYLMSDILAIMLIASLLAAALNPMVDRLERAHIPRSFGVLIGYIVIFLLVSVVVVALIPMLASQGEKLIGSLISFFQKTINEGVTSIPLPFLSQSTEQWLVFQINEFRTHINVDLIFTQLQDWLLQNQGTIKDNLQQVATNFLGVLNTVFNGLTNVVLVLFISFFLVAEKQTIKEYCLSLFPHRYRPYLGAKLHDVQFKVGAWVRGQLILGLAVGMSTYFGLWFLIIFGVDIPYKETLAIIAGLTELIPVVGPVIAAIFGILVAANVGTVPMIAVFFLFVAIQQLENNILVPVIMDHAVGINAIIIILGMTVGAKFFGILGLILAVPVLTVLSLFVDDVRALQNQRK